MIKVVGWIIPLLQLNNRQDDDLMGSDATLAGIVLIVILLGVVVLIVHELYIGKK